MKQQAYLAKNGESHHYKIDQVLRWMQDRFEDGRLTPNSGDAKHLGALRNILGTLPDEKASVAAATEAFHLVHAYRTDLTGMEYSDMYGVLESALAELNGPSVRTFLQQPPSKPR